MANPSEPESPNSGPMRTGPSESADQTTRPGRSPSPASIILAVVSILLLAWLAWWLNPRQPGFKPAPLNPPSAVCVNPSRAFVPSNVMDIPVPILSGLPAEVRTRVIRRLNFEKCTCGCNLSIASCLASNPNCETADRLLKQIVEEEKDKGSRNEGSK